LHRAPRPLEWIIVLDGVVELSEGALQVRWSSKQGLHTHVELYRNSPVMHELVPDEYKPILLKDGVRIPFPPPTRRVRKPRTK